MLQEDWIGMRALHEAGKLEFRGCPGDHMHFNLEWWVHSSLPMHVYVWRQPAARGMDFHRPVTRQNLGLVGHAHNYPLSFGSTA